MLLMGGGVLDGWVGHLGGGVGWGGFGRNGLDWSLEVQHHSFYPR